MTAPLRKEPELDDPLELRGVVLPAADDTSLREMTLCFIEEFLRDGWSEAQLRELFRNPFYTGPHMVWKQKGDAFISEVIQEVRQAWGRPAEGANHAEGV